MERLPEHLQISDAFEELDPQLGQRWWSSQREHMVAWFSAQMTKGEGQFTRETPNHSARTTYNRLQCPEAIVWMAEAVGVSEDKLVATVDAALFEPDHRRRSGIVRKHLPWSLIAEHVLKHAAWQ